MSINIPSQQYRAQNVRIINYNAIDNIDVDEKQNNFVKNIFKQYKGQTIQIALRYYKPTRGAIIIDSEITDIPKTGFNSWWNIFTQTQLWPDSEHGWIFDEYYNPLGKDQAQIMIMSANKVGMSNYQQFFLDGTTHCVFQPILNWCQEKKDNATSKQAKSRYNVRIKKTQKYIEQYSAGVPADDFQKITDDLQIGIEIDIPSTLTKETKFIKVCSTEKPLRTFRFINTRLNHIELNQVSSTNNYIEVSQNELQKIFDETEFKLWKGDREGELYQINTLENTYKLTNEEGYLKALKEFEDIHNLNYYRVEHNSNKELSRFLFNNINRNLGLVLDNKYQEGTEDHNIFLEYIKNNEQMIEDQEDGINLEIIDYVNSLKNLNHIDIRKAYTRGAECSFYKGYLGKITDFRSCDKIMGLGIFMICNIQNIPDIFEKCGILYENNCYPSPELEFYKSLGITFDIVCGCWGSRIDIDFGQVPAEGEKGKGMYEKDENGKSHYVKWYGCLMKLSKYERYTFHCKDIEFAKLNNINDKGSDIRFNEYKNQGIIEYKRDKCYHSSHIASFIHSYSRINLLEQILKFKDTSQIVAINVDGIFYRGDVEVGKLFAIKKGKIDCIHSNVFIEDMENDIPNLPKNREHNLVEVHTGPGGAGKTHINLMDKGLQSPLYVAHSWKLARTKEKEYNIPCSVNWYLLSTNPKDYLPIMKNYNTLIIDEISCLSNKDKKIILNKFPKHKIIFCGDLGYQLPPVEGYEFNSDGLKIIKHTKNHRCQCEKLQKILKKMRILIDRDFIDIEAKTLLKKYKFKIHKKEDIDYKVEDLIIAKTHKSKDYYTCKYAPYDELETMKIKTQTKLQDPKLNDKRQLIQLLEYCNHFLAQQNKEEYKKYSVKIKTGDCSQGEIIIGEKPDGVDCEIQHGFTIHAIQGETASHTLFIDINRMKCTRMLYTALSRAKLFSQIKIIE